MMQLYYGPTSPFVQKVLALAIETGQEDALQRVPSSPWSDDDPLPGVNPIGKVPALCLEDGVVLAGSQVICEFLDSRHGGRRLFPPEGSARWHALGLQYLADGLMEAGVAIVVERLRRPQELLWPAWIARQTKKIGRALDALERQAAAQALAGPLTIGTLSIAIALGYIDFRLPELAWRGTRPALAAWEEQQARRPSLVRTRLVAA
jgi:glutathione S-transferase